MTKTAAAGVALEAGVSLAHLAPRGRGIRIEACGLLEHLDRLGGVSIQAEGAPAREEPHGGALLGVVNRAAGASRTRRALARGMQAAMGTLVGGFFARLVLVAALIVVFHRTGAVDEVAFALVFMIFFFAYVALELRMVDGAGRAA